MREIEVKAKAKDFGALIDKLQSLGCKISDPINQKDYIYGKPGISLLEWAPGRILLRIRDQDGKYIFTYKHSLNTELDKVEREVEVSDPKQMEDIINFLDFQKIIEVHKIRRKVKYQDYEICLDKVKGLGDFVEVEKMSVDGDGEKIQQELWNFLKSLGVAEEDRVTVGYDRLIYAKQNS